MKKLMIGLVTLAAVVGATALPAAAAEWFNGGVAEGWPTAASLSGGAWTNTESSAFAEGAVAFTNASASALTFAATEAKAPADGEIAIDATVSLPPRATLPAPRAKAGVVSHGGFFYVLAKDLAGTNNVWTKTDIVATDTAKVKVVFTSATAATYTINGFTTNATIASVESVRNVKLSGTGTLSALTATAPAPDYLTFTAQEANSSVAFKWADGTDVMINTNGTWEAYTAGTTIPLAEVGDKVMFKGKSVKTDKDNCFSMTGKIAASGDVGTLTDGKGGADVALSVDGCYSSMFAGCKSLTAVPVLPATNMTKSCYLNIFQNCSALVVNTYAPGKEWSIPANAKTATFWLAGMFQGTSGNITNKDVSVGTTYYVRSAVSVIETNVVTGATLTEVSTNGEAVVAGEYGYVVEPNALVKVVYTADAGYEFPGGATTWTTNFTASAMTVAVTIPEDEKPTPILDPSVMIGKPAQRYPWNGIVDVPFQMLNLKPNEALTANFTVTVQGKDYEGGKTNVSAAAGGTVTGSFAIDFRALNLPVDRGEATVKADPAAVGGASAVWFSEATVRFDTSYTTNDQGIATFFVTHPDQVLPVAYSTNNWGKLLDGVTVDLLYQGPTYGPTTFITTSVTNGLYNWTLGASDYGYHNFGAMSVNSDGASTNWLDGTVFYTTNFHLTVTQSEGGTIAAYTNEVAAGNDSWPLGLVDEVKLVATPAGEFWRVEYVATNGEGRALAPASAAAVTNTFVMPPSDVAVTAQFRYVGVELQSNAVDHASAKFYTNGVEVAATGDKTIVITNTPAVVVYTAEEGYFFDGGKTVVTNDLDTAKNPATGASPAAPTYGTARIVETGVRYVTVQAAVNAAASGQTVQMLTNSIENVTFAANQTNTLDLAGWVLKGTGSGSVVTVSAGANLTVTDTVATAVHYYTVDSNARLWNWNDANATDAVPYEDLTARPAKNAVVAVKGGAITGGNMTGYGGGILVGSNATLTLGGGNLVGNKATLGGGGVAVGDATQTGGSLLLNAGVVCGNVEFNSINKTESGGGVYVAANSALTMNGGDVAYNYAAFCGGGIGNRGVFKLTGGSIFRNRGQSSGGGIFTGCASDLGSAFTMTGGMISGNESNMTAGGLGSDAYAIVRLLGGSIITNKSAKAGGVESGYGANASYTLGGDIKITGNTLSDGKTPNNLYFYENNTVAITNDPALASTALIGVTTETAPAAYAPVAITSNGEAADLAYFTSDNPAYIVKFATDHLILSVPDVSFVPSSVDHATAAVYTNDAPMVTAETYVMPSNATATVVYTAEGEYFFEGGRKVVTNEIDTTKNPATVQGDLPKVLDPVKYVAPTYVDNIASNGIAYWTTNTLYGYTVVRSAASRVTWGTAGATNWYVVAGSDVAITGGVLCAGNVHLVLCDGAKLMVTNVADTYAGIQTDASGSFTVYGQPDGAGELSATGGGNGAGIGGVYNVAGSNITINGGAVAATGGEYGAGIGGGHNGAGLAIVINGGTVTATGGDKGAGIGGGNGSAGGSAIVINGGTVTATGVRGGAGIGGGGSKGAGSNITINGGNVTANGGDNAAGIGGGLNGAGSNIVINGGAVTATGGAYGAGIGGGRTGAGQNISIVSGLVFVATAEIKNVGVADLIGCGYNCTSVASGNSISADAKVFFNLTGVNNDKTRVEAIAPMPETVEGIAIMTRGTQTVDRVLVGGAQGLSALPAFALTNAVTGATSNITVNAAEHTDFANVFLHLTNDVNNLTLKVEKPTFTITQQPTLDNLYTIAAETDGSDGITNYAWCAVASGVVVAQGETLTIFPPEKGEAGSNYICRVTYGHHGAYYTADSEAFVYGGVPQKLTVTQPAEGGALAAYTNGVSEATKVADASTTYAGRDTVSIVATPTDWSWQVEWVKTNDVEFGRALAPASAAAVGGATALPVTNSFTMPFCDVTVTGSFVVSDAYRADASNTIGTAYLTTSNTVGALKRLTDEERQFFLDAAEDARTNALQTVCDPATRLPTVVDGAVDVLTNGLRAVGTAAQTMNDLKPWTIVVGSEHPEDGTNYFDKIDTAFNTLKFLPYATNIVVFGEQRATVAMCEMVFDWKLTVWNWNAAGQVDETKSPYQQSRLVFEESAQVDALTNRLTKVDGEGRILFANDGKKVAAKDTAEAFAQALRDVAGEPAEAKVQALATAHDIAMEGVSYERLDGEYVAIDSLTLKGLNAITNWVALSAPAVTNRTELTWDLTGDNQTTCLANYDDVVTNGATLFISLDDDQTVGSVVAKYVIAGRAATADGATFKLVNGKTDVGDLVVGGGVQYYGSKAYTLALVEAASGTSNLVLDISWGMFTVSYDAMDGKWSDGTTVSNIATYVKDGYVFPEKEPTRVNYEFLGWYVSWTNGAAQIEKSGDPLTVYDNHTIYAQWKSMSVDPSEAAEKLDGKVIDGGKAVMLTGGKTNVEGKISSPVSSDFAIPDRVGSGADARYVTVIASEAYRKDKYDDKVGAANKLTSVQLPSFLTRIGSEAFYACTNVTNVVFAVAKDYTTNEKTVLSVGSRAFAGIAAETVVFPAGSKTRLGAGCFGNCPNLKEIYVFGEIDDIDKAPFFKSGNGGTITVHLSPTYAADKDFVARLTADMNTSKVTINSEPLGKVEILSGPTTESGKVTFTFKANITSPWGAVNKNSVTLFYATDLDDGFVGTGKFRYATKVTGPDASGTYTAVFEDPNVGSNALFFRITVGAERAP